MKTNSNGHTLTLFTQSTVVREIGYTRLAKFLDLFREELSPELLSLLTRLTTLSEVTTYRETLNSTPSPEIVELAVALADPAVLPERLRAAIFTLEAAASPENQAALDAAITRRIPCVSINTACALDRALELWFAAPDALAPFAPPGAASGPQSNNPIIQESTNPSVLAPPTPHSDTPSLQHSTTPHSDAAAFERLAQLSPTEYDRIRKSEARRLHIRIETLDAEVARCKTRLDDAQANTTHLPPVVPWPEPVDGSETLSQTSDRFSLQIVLPPGAADALALWSTHAHAFAAFPQTPRLNLSSPEPGCGKTTALDVIASLVPRPLRTENLTAPVLFRLVDQYQPTLLLDEVDSYLHQAEELRGLLNAGHKRGSCAYRCEGENKSVRAFKAFAPAALAGLGPLTGTLADRSIRIPLLPARPEELAARFDSFRAPIEKELCRKLARWAQDNFPALQACDPQLPPTAFNRLADNWRPLFAIAQVAGGDWPARALAAFTSLTKVGTLSTASQTSTPPCNSFNNSAHVTQLLTDIRHIFTESNATRIASKRLVDLLCARADRPWNRARQGKPINGHWLAGRLSSIGIKPSTMRIGRRLAKGYEVSDFTEAFSRLLRKEPPSANGGAPSLESEP